MIKINLDSNVFRNQRFINWLILNRNKFTITISIIVYVETLFWYLTRGSSFDEFTDDLNEIKVEIINLNKKLANKTAENALDSDLPFKHHARDFIIGTSAKSTNSLYLTYNLKYFKWLPKSSVTTPELFVENYLGSIQKERS